MGRLKSNAPGSRNRHSPTRDSRDSDGRLFGSLAAFKLAIKPSLKKNRSDSFRKAFTPRLILLFQKMRGWLRAGVAFEPRPCRCRHLDDLLLVDRQLRPRGPALGTFSRGTLRLGIGCFLHSARFVWLDVRSAGTAFKAGDLVAQRGNCSLQLSYHFKLTYDQALQLGVGQAVKIRRRNHCQNESDSRQSVNLKIIPSPLLLPILRNRVRCLWQGGRILSAKPLSGRSHDPCLAAMAHGS